MSGVFNDKDIEQLKKMMERDRCEEHRYTDEEVFWVDRVNYLLATIDKQKEIMDEMLVIVKDASETFSPLGYHKEHKYKADLILSKLGMVEKG